MNAKVCVSIRAKLSLIFFFLITFLFASSFYILGAKAKKSIIASTFEKNEAINARTATACQNLISKYQEETINLLQTADYLSSFSSDTFEAELFAFLENYFSLNDSVYFVYGDKIGTRVNESNLKRDTASENYFSAWVSSTPEGLYNISPVLNQPVIALIFNFKKGHSAQKCAVSFSGRSFISLMGAGNTSVSFLTDSNGQLLVSSSIEDTLKAQNKFSAELENHIKNKDENHLQFISKDENDNLNLYNIQKITSAKNCLLVTKIPQKKAMETVDSVKKLIILVYIFTALLGLFLIRTYSSKIIRRLEQLTEALRFIEAGKFNIGLSQKSKDELSVTTEAFNHMATSLEELRSAGKVAEVKNLKKNVLYSGAIMKIKLDFSASTSEDYSKIISDNIIKGKGRLLLQGINEFTCIWTTSDFNESLYDAVWNSIKTAFLIRYAIFVINKERKEKQQKSIRAQIGISCGEVSLKASTISETGNLLLAGLPVETAEIASELNKEMRTDIILESKSYNLIKEKIIATQIDEEKTNFSDEKYFAAINAAGMKGPQNLTQLIKALI